MLNSETPIYTPKLVHRANEFKMATVLRRYMPAHIQFNDAGTAVHRD
jgi:hypothetical protein